ncbi:ATP-binding protein [Thauera sp. CAU 1555]|uniref:ATP-binding protein n=1 Tax=Thauera sedimentorum TaxID=2767595 RepID=A0ABR9BCC3_9RHOO|nr:ATP-binding protein [Thauera sedimentorum]MBC9072942.1 ATP-binding protein [Thauera sedimentorum]MBD8503861.1 ATP-binding protein [Thauera sedimentorum]
MSLDTPFPFTALHGQPLLQTALLLATVDPLIGGVLVEGPRGTAKSTAARALAALLPGGRFVNLPLSASEEQLVGSLDLEAALQGGQVRFRPGMLARAHEGVLYVDEVNLLADGLVDLLLDVCASGVNRIERDGISHAHAARITLVGTMNPEEGELRPQLLDRFGLFVRLGDTLAPAERQAIVRARLAFDADPATFAARHAPAQQALAARIAAARAALPAIAFGDADHERVAALCHAAAVEGVRADLVMLRAARAHAALDGRGTITAADIDAVAELVLAHRRKADDSADEPADAPHPQGGQSQQPDNPPPAADSADDWGALPPQAVPIRAVKNVRPLSAKKP